MFLFLELSSDGEPRASEVNFYRTFILCISSLLQLVGVNLAQKILNPSEVLPHWLFLLGVSVVFVNTEKSSSVIKLFPCNCTRPTLIQPCLIVPRQTDFIKIDNFNVFLGSVVLTRSI